MKASILFLLLSLFLLVSNEVKADKLKVVFINPGHPKGDATGAFWSNVDRFMHAAADDLNVDLISLYANRNHILMKQLAQKAIELQPDYVIVVNEKGAAFSIVQELSAREIKSFLLLNNLSKVQFSRLPKSQQEFFIGSLIPDNYHVGQALMEELLAIHNDKVTMDLRSRSYHLLAIQGDYSSAAAVERKQGLMDFISNGKQVTLIDSSVANWSEEEAYTKVKGLLKRQQIDIIWAANDPMAQGARRAVKEAKLDYPVTIGGINWDEQPKEYPLDVSFGGHVTLGAKAIAMLFDFHHGLPDNNMHIKVKVFKPLSTNKVARFRAFIADENMSAFDFSRFSKTKPSNIEFDVNYFITEKAIE